MEYPPFVWYICSVKRVPKSPTQSQRKILRLLLERELSGMPPPTYREICAATGWRATGTVRDHVAALVGKGLVSRSRLSRGTRLTDAGRAEARGPAPEPGANPMTARYLSSGAKSAFALLDPYFRKRTFPAGSIIWNRGEEANLVVAIDEGYVKTFRQLPDGNIAPINVFGPGDVFGLMPCFDRKPYPASAMAIDDVRAGTISHEGLERAMRERPEVLFPLFSFLGQCIRDAFDRIEILSGHGVLTRVAGALAKLAPADEEGGLILARLPVASGEFARTLGITPESFSRAVTILADMGLIRRLGRGRFQVLEPGSLRRLGYPSGL